MERDSDRNLLFGVLALQAGLIDTRQFMEACALSQTGRTSGLPDILLERGWISGADKTHVDCLVQRKVQEYGCEATVTISEADSRSESQNTSLKDPVPAKSELRTTDCDRITETETAGISRHKERYTVVRLHAAGGVGRVWVARDKELGREIALKELQPEKAGSAMLARRFLREARITSQLEHPGIVPVYEVGLHPLQGQPFYTMRLVKGRTLTAEAQAYHHNRQTGEVNPASFLALLNAFVTVCNTVAYAHSRKVIHRDLKGQNVVLGDFGEVVVLDWGLAKLMDRSDGIFSDVEGNSSVELGLTLDGQTVGTPAYMAPEQAAGLVELVSYSTDVYGLGAMLYEILTGIPPFKGRDMPEVLRKVRHEQPMLPRQV